MYRYIQIYTHTYIQCHWRCYLHGTYFSHKPRPVLIHPHVTSLSIHIPESRPQTQAVRGLFLKHARQCHVSLPALLLLFLLDCGISLSFPLPRYLAESLGGASAVLCCRGTFWTRFSFTLQQILQHFGSRKKPWDEYRSLQFKAPLYYIREHHENGNWVPYF